MRLVTSRRSAFAAAGAVIVLALEGIAYASSMRALRAAVFFIGIGGGVINDGANALVADVSSKVRRGAAISYLGVFFGLGAMGVPIVLGMLLGRFSYSRSSLAARSLRHSRRQTT